MEFSEKLQELRKARSLTQEELAGALYVSRTAVSKWESGRGTRASSR
ncbi:MAG: helix-turn-helix transcriptional regulator [Atopobiaceae bacterium]|nr:helix-turn-helix transcriptional regulator [Atopobiaceae bacterium]